MLIDDLTVTVVPRNVKRMRIECVPPDWQIEVIAPKETSIEVIERYVRSNAQKIRLHLAVMARHSTASGKRISPREYVSGESIWHWGTRKLLSVHVGEPSTVVSIKSIDLFVPPNSTVKQRRSVMYDFYRSELIDFVPAQIDWWNKQVGAQTVDWRVKNLKSSWARLEGNMLSVNLQLATVLPGAAKYAVGSVIARSVGKTPETYMTDWRMAKSNLADAVLEGA
ncbi:MAG: YgjP-like metallopeptidase domain-containing protein [Solirubrobacterales bacterium]